MPERHWVVSVFAEPERLAPALADLQREGFDNVGVLVAEEMACAVAGVPLEEVGLSETGTILAGGLPELAPDRFLSLGSVAAGLEELGIDREEVDCCLAAIEKGEGIVIVRTDERYSEALAILNSEGATDTIREVQR